jgi:hypothetical protein
MSRAQVRASPRRGEEMGVGDFRGCGLGRRGAGPGSPPLRRPRRSAPAVYSAPPSCLLAASPRQVLARAACRWRSQHGVAPYVPQLAHFSAIVLAIAVCGSVVLVAPLLRSTPPPPLVCLRDFPGPIPRSFPSRGVAGEVFDNPEAVKGGGLGSPRALKSLQIPLGEPPPGVEFSSCVFLITLFVCSWGFWHRAANMTPH